MAMKIDFDTDNAAFDDPIEQLKHIFGRILTALHEAEAHRGGYYSGLVRDTNGNRIGHYKLCLDIDEEEE